MNIQTLCVGPIQTNCYIIIADNQEQTERFCAVIDPGDDFQVIKQSLSALSYTTPSCNLTHIILTHAHFDHVGAVQDLHEAYPNAKFAVGENEPLDSVYTFWGRKDLQIPKPNILLSHDDIIGSFRVIYTPGHTKGSICLYSQKDNILLSGDTLFKGSYGRTDLGGSMQDMRDSLEKLSKLPPSTKVLPGHGSPTTIEAELRF